MLYFDLRSLESSAARVEAGLAADDSIWLETDAKPVEQVSVSGRLSSAGPGKFYFSGHIKGSAATTCRRCLDEVEVEVEQAVHMLLVGQGEDEADEPDVYLVDLNERQLDLRPAIREEWLLAVPAYAVCSETCLGLCPTCGANRNHGNCSCKPVLDPRWGSLTSLRDA